MSDLNKLGLADARDLLRKGEAPDINHVLAGDVVDDGSMARDRLTEAERTGLISDARKSMERMIDIVEGSKS